MLMAAIMATSECPCCGAATQLVQSKTKPELAYCASCGWNVARVQQVIALRSRSLKFGLIVMAALLGSALIFSPNKRNSLESAGFVAALVISFVVISQKRLSKESRKLATLSADSNAGTLAGNSGQGKRTAPKPDTAILAEFDRLRSLPRPRTLRLNAAARSALYLVMIFPVGMWLWGIHDLIAPDHPISFSKSRGDARRSGTIMLALGVVTWFTFSRLYKNKVELDLMKNGEIALAQVVQAPPSSSAFSLKVAYEFTDTGNRTVEGKDLDIERGLDEGTWFLLLYDPERPEHRLALRGSNYEFAGPK